MDVTIPAEVTREVIFTVVKEIVGEYTVEIGELSGTLTVVEPAEFQLSSLVVTPQEVLPDEEVTVTVDVCKYVLGYWYSERFAVKQGEVIGKVKNVVET